jgi:hypothetical protein
MNERIQALMEQAMELVDPYALEGEFGPRQLNAEKFAELIVRECAEFAEQDQGSGDVLASRMKKHFGVE